MTCKYADQLANSFTYCDENKTSIICNPVFVKVDEDNDDTFQFKRKVHDLKSFRQKSIFANTNCKIDKEKTQLLDDTLTNLNWLTVIKIDDILEGKLISYTSLSPALSISSDEGDNKKNDTKFAEASNDYRSNESAKPPYSYAALIIMAMKSKPCGKMTLSEIYKWIGDHFSFYKYAEPSWQNSIRHNLSLNKCFTKIPRNKGDPGKGGYWTVVPEFANKLLENNIRKRRTSMIDFSCCEAIKQQRLEMLETQLLHKLKQESYHSRDLCKAQICYRFDEPRNLSTDEKCGVSEQNFIALKQENDDLSLNAVRKLNSKASECKTNFKIAASNADDCMKDHSYGKRPVIKYFPSDEDNITAIAHNLLQSTSNIRREEILNLEPYSTFSKVMRADCNWSSEQISADSLMETMTEVAEELIEARDLSPTSESTFLIPRNLGNINGVFSILSSPLYLSPPISGDDTLSGGDACFTGKLKDESCDIHNEINLFIEGTSMVLHEPSSISMKLSSNSSLDIDTTDYVPLKPISDLISSLAENKSSKRLDVIKREPLSPLIEYIAVS